MKKKLKERYGYEIVLTETHEKANVITYSIFHLAQFYNEDINDQSEEEEKMGE